MMENNQTIQLGAVTLNVNNLEIQGRFYEEVIGLHIIEESSQKISLGIKETGEILLNLLPLEPKKNRLRETGLYHVAFLLPTRGALGGILRHLLEIKVPLGGAADHGYSEALYLNDPEGNGIEIYWDKPRDVWNVQPKGKIPGITIEMDAQGVLDASVGSLSKMPEGTKVGHVHLTGVDFEKNVSFYQDILGFSLTDDLGGHARFFGMDGYHHQIGVNNWLGEGIPTREENSLGINQYEIIWESALDFIEMKEKLAQKNYPIELKSDNVFKIVDPNGIIVYMELKK